MEFLGFTAEDFDFFRKKDKMVKEEYEKNRNDVKLHFRALCYELQKIYHKKTIEVLEINKEFTNFSKRSINIGADYGDRTDVIKKVIELNTDNLAIRLVFNAVDEDSSEKVLNIIKDKKDIIWNYIISDKHNQILVGFKGKNSKIEFLKYNSLDMNAKNYETFVNFIQNNIKSGKVNYELVIQHVCPRNEAIKQSKNLSNLIYQDLINTKELYSKLS